jgi:hypothetical protein
LTASRPASALATREAGAGIVVCVHPAFSRLGLAGARTGSDDPHVEYAPRYAIEPSAGVCGDGASRAAPVSPAVFREGPFRFFFFSREELRLHIHVQSADGEAKFWIGLTSCSRAIMG